MFKSKPLVLAFIFAALFLAAAGTAFAQVGELRGHVLRQQSDGSKTAATDALIDVYRVDLKDDYHGRTDRTGNFIYAGLPLAGTYIIAASAPGAGPVAVSNVRAGRNIDYEIILKPGDGKRLSEVEARWKSYIESPNSNDTRPGGGVKPSGGSAGETAAKDTTPPQIKITSPQLDRGLKLSTQASKITVAGQATDESGVNDVLVQGVAARLDEQGNFSADVLLSVGENKITVTAIDLYGNRAASDFTLRREAQNAASAAAETARGRRVAAPGALLRARHRHQRLQVSAAPQDRRRRRAGPGGDPARPARLRG